MLDRLLRGVQGCDVKSTIYLYLFGLAALAPIALLIGIACGEEFAFQITPLLCLGLVAIQSAVFYGRAWLTRDTLARSRYNAARFDLPPLFEQPTRQLSVIVPVYNESQRIAAILRKLVDYLRQQHGWAAELIVVDDGSMDNTAGILREFSQNWSLSLRDPVLRIVENIENRGAGYSIRQGALLARGEVLLFIGCDSSAPVSEAMKLVQAIMAGADVAIGRGGMGYVPKWHMLRWKLAILIPRLLLGLQYGEMDRGGFKAISRAAARAIIPRLQIERWGYDYDLLFLAQKTGYRVDEIRLERWSERKTEIPPLRDAVRMFGKMLRVRWSWFSGRYPRSTSYGESARFRSFEKHA